MEIIFLVSFKFLFRYEFSKNVEEKKLFSPCVLNCTFMEIGYKIVKKSILLIFSTKREKENTYNSVFSQLFMLLLNFSAGSDLHKGSEIDFKSNVNF